MAAKFLPFITPASTPVAILKALVQRSKGVSPNNIQIIYHAILGCGIDKIKQYADNLPESLPSNEIIAELAKAHSEYLLPEFTSQFWREVLTYYGYHNIASEASFDNLEKRILISGLSRFFPDELLSVGFTLDNKFMGTDSYTKLFDLKYTKFSDQGVEVHFSSEEELYAFISVREARENSYGIILIKPVSGACRTSENIVLHTSMTSYEESEDVPF